MEDFLDIDITDLEKEESNKFKKLREKADMFHQKQADFAKDIAHCSTGKWSEIETGKSLPNFFILSNILSYRQKCIYPKLLNCNYYLQIDYLNNDIDKQHSYFKLLHECETFEDIVSKLYGLNDKALDQLFKLKNGEVKKNELIKASTYTTKAFNDFVSSKQFLNVYRLFDDALINVVKNKDSIPKRSEIEKIVNTLTSRLSFVLMDYFEKHIAETLANDQISKEEIITRLHQQN